MERTCGDAYPIKTTKYAKTAFLKEEPPDISRAVTIKRLARFPLLQALLQEEHARYLL
jgi:hypothetical protein